MNQGRGIGTRRRSLAVSAALQEDGPLYNNRTKGISKEATPEREGRTWEDDVLPLNETFQRLDNRRLSEVRREGPLAESKLAWKVAVYREAILHRTVMLADGCAEAWNSGNIICAILAGRAIVETAALVLDSENQARGFVGDKDFESLDAFVMNRIFGTRLPDWKFGDLNLSAVNVLTIINKLDRGRIPGIGNHYAVLSETCHPNSLGHHQLFTTTDYETGTVTYTHNRRVRALFPRVIASFVMLGFVERALAGFDDLIIEIAKAAR